MYCRIRILRLQLQKWLFKFTYNFKKPTFSLTIISMYVYVSEKPIARARKIMKRYPTFANKCLAYNMSLAPFAVLV